MIQSPCLNNVVEHVECLDVLDNGKNEKYWDFGANVIKQFSDWVK